MRFSLLGARRTGSLLALPAIALVAYACGGSTAATGGADAGFDAADAGVSLHDAAPPPTTPGLPPDPGGPTPDGTGSVVLAMSHLYMGDTDRNGVPSGAAWKQYGLNLDGKITTRDSTDVCALSSGASRTTQVDGAGGIDNSWGANVLPIWLTIFGSDFSKRMNDAINRGGFTMMVRVDKLGSQDNYAPLPGSFYTGAGLQSSPTWSGNDVWPVTFDSVVGGDINQPNVVFAQGYMNARQYVGAPPVNGLKLLPIGGVGAFVSLSRAQITMRVAADGSSATDGMIVGVIPTEDYVLELKKVAGRISTSLCSGAAFDSIAQQIRQAQDIMIDGTNQPGVSCNGISFGWGFDAKRVQLGAVAPPSTPSGDPCGPPDAGH